MTNKQPTAAQIRDIAGAHGADAAFFYEWAAPSYMPGKETEEAGRLRNAQEHATAEAAARDKGFAFTWTIDLNGDSRDFAKGKRYDLWECVTYNGEGKQVGVLCGIDFGRGGKPWGDPYRRVVESELAMDALSGGA